MPKSDLLEKRKEKVAELSQRVNLYPNDFKVSHTIGDVKQLLQTALSTADPAVQAKKTSAESVLDNQTFSLAGRMMAVNRFGKAAFIRFRDRTGQLQAYIRKDKVGSTAFDLFKQLDIGDFVGLSGGLFQTKTGEWTLLAESFTLVCKALNPLPEKFHGLKDPEKRYRQRHLDLIMNARVRELFKKRSAVVQAVRRFLLQRDFLEVETPMMQPIPGGAEATPFKTHHNALGMDLYLRIAPELYLKRLVVGGFERVFEINRNFRNEGISTQHNPEFTMLEFYQAYADYHELMQLTEEMFRTVADSVVGSRTIQYQGHTIDFESAWQRIPLMEAMQDIGGVEPQFLKDRERLCRIASTRGIAVDSRIRLGKIITKLFDALVEPKLIQPTFITGYPVEVSPLSRRSESDPSLTDRFELFIAGKEIANGFSELNDPMDQKARFQQQAADRAGGDQEAHIMDEDYIEALSYGMPPTAGEGVGIDRMTMLFADAPSIREVILFPHMKAKGA